jgi:hypothetical protein
VPGGEVTSVSDIEKIERRVVELLGKSATPALRAQPRDRKNDQQLQFVILHQYISRKRNNKFVEAQKNEKKKLAASHPQNSLAQRKQTC